MRPLSRGLSIYALLVLLSGAGAQASQMSFGVGGGYSQFSLADATGDTGSIYRGPKITAELRYRFSSNDLFSSSSSTNGFDVFILFGGNLTDNVGDGINESLFQSHYGAGLDVTFSNFFVGAQYVFNRAIIHNQTSSNKTDLMYQGVSFRGGANFPIGKDFFILIGGLYEPGVVEEGTNAIDESRQFDQLGGFIFLHYSFLNNDSPF